MSRAGIGQGGGRGEEGRGGEEWGEEEEEEEEAHFVGTEIPAGVFFCVSEKPAVFWKSPWGEVILLFRAMAFSS